MPHQMHYQKSKSKYWPTVALPSPIFADRSSYPTGPLGIAILSAFRIKQVSQWRNFNIDPDWYLGKIGVYETGDPIGVKQMMDLIKEEFPNVKFGYFNPPKERMLNFENDFAH